MIIIKNTLFYYAIENDGPESKTSMNLTAVNEGI